MISFPIASYSSHAGYILKLNPPDKPRLVENEYFFMRLARACGISTSKVWLVHDRHREAGLLVERFDRRWDRIAKALIGSHTEDWCQLLNRYPADKYRVTCSEIAESLESCAARIAARAEFLRQLAFSYAIGNGDLHAKNVSVVDSDVGWVLSPAYDLLSTLPYRDRSMALQFEGRDDNFRRKHFVSFGTRFGVGAKAIHAMLDRVCTAIPAWLARLGEVGLESKREADLQRTIKKRLGDLAA